MTEMDFTADCSACHALCCLALAFDAGDRFAHDKPAGLPCHHLAGHACAIHADLDTRGYQGCTAYDCLGAGQRVSGFYPQSWKDAPKQTSAMLDDFATMREVQELLQMLMASRTLPLSEARRSEAVTIMAQLAAARESQAALSQFRDKSGAAAVRLWLKSLAEEVPR